MHSIALVACTLVTVLSLGAAPPSNGAFHPEAHLPASTLVLVDLSLSEDVMGKAQRTSLWKLWEDPEVQRFLKKPIEVMVKDFAAWTEIVKEDPGVELGLLLKLIPPERIAFALPAMDFEKGEPLDLVLFAGMGEKAGDTRKAIDHVLDVAKKKAEKEERKFEVSEREVSGTKVKRIVNVRRVPEQARFAAEIAFKGDVLVTVLGEESEELKISIDRYLAPDKTLADEEGFRAARGRVQGEVPFAFVRLDAVVEGLVKAAEKKRGEEKEEDAGSQEEKPDVGALMKALGISSIRAVAYGQAIEGGDLVDKFYIHAPEPRSGLLFAIVAGGTLPRDRLARFAPKTAQIYGEMALDLAKVWESVGTIVEAVSDGGEFRKGVGAVEKEIGTSLPELLGCFHNRVAAYSTIPQTLSSIGDQGIILPLRDTKRFRDILAKVREIPKVKEAVLVQDEMYKDVEVVSINLRNLPVPIIPSYAILDDHLVIAENPFSLKKLIASLKSGTGCLADAEGFRSEAEEAFPEGASYGMYIDMPIVVERVYELAASVLNMLMANPQAQQGLDEFGFDLSLLPSAKTVARPLGLGRECLLLDASGVEYRGRSPFGAGYIGVYKTAVACAVPFVVMGECRDRVWYHREEASRKHLKLIYDALSVYSKTTGGGRYPRDLVALLKAGLIEEEVLVAPGDPSPRAEEDPETGGEVRISYRYRPEGFGGERRGVVLYESGTWRGGEKRLVVFKDGIIEKVWNDRGFQELLKRGD